MTGFVIIVLPFFARMAFIIVEKLTFFTVMATSIIFEFLFGTFMAGTAIEVFNVLRTKMALMAIEVMLARRALAAFSVIEEWRFFRAFGDCSSNRRKRTLVTMRFIFGTFMASSIEKILLVLRASVTSAIFVLVLQIFGAAAGIDKRVPYLGCRTVSTVSILIYLIWE